MIEALHSARDKARRLPGAVWYLAVGGVTSLLALFAVVGLLIVGAFCLIGVGIPALPEAVRLVRPLVSFDRRRAAGYLGEQAVRAYQPLTGGLRQRVATVFTDPANRRDFGWLVAHALTGIYLAVFAIALPLSTLAQLAIPAFWQRMPPGQEFASFGFAVDSWPKAILSVFLAIPVALVTLQLPVAARWQALATRAMLKPTEDALLADRVAALTATRAAALDAHGAELRRIERDLHDGAQARLAAVIMQLGMADQLRDQDPDTARELVRKAQDTATAALAELRDVVRNVYPPVLADRGLASAVAAVAARNPIPCVLDLGEVGRLPAAAEAAAYFVITEALTNATKHSGATAISLALGGTPELLTVEIRDDGVGGAVEIYDGGLAGIRRRAEALDGRMVLTSPPGGPTVVRVELPCGS
ncbi:histidine kinase [Nocardia neocaledoniensis NBRC 108232]|uniref:histidine kinase n=1 Tax=Nocardia neocaledoniensis TaxID=236511 RepID=A0A317P296_9NOCA|nr:sensor domain-containing protein [Nocardia neocaledoniensis]PWV81527.1 signal transduction histidine kinase [Nocardia neocaledoniensis]GEM32149.1 histidine kinase [Nocardia neocaledoniensis NBRC 108232]